MAADSPFSAGNARIEHEAAAWAAKRDLGMSPADQDAFFQWLADDPRHSEGLARQQRTVAGLRLLAQWRPEHGSRPNPDLLASPGARPNPAARRPSFRWLVPLGLAVAACLAVILWRERSGRPLRVAPVAAVSPVVRKVLEDGSTVDLIRESTVEVSYSAERRDVQLVQGEANFTVTKNPNRPFIVSAGGVQVRAVGTAFNVNLEPKYVEILVTEGRVQVNPPAGTAAGLTRDTADAPPLVHAGQRAVVFLNGSVPPSIQSVSPSDLARILTWKARQLDFSDTPLAQVVAEFNSDNALKMVVDDPVLAALPIGASIRSDNVEGFVRILEASFKVKAERRSDGVIVLRRDR
jgi:transmembrane sensor